MAKLDDNGHEILSQERLAVPVRFKRSQTLTEQIRAVIRSEALASEAQAMGFETFEEADDFDVGDDYDPRSQYELSLDQELEGYGERDEGRPVAGKGDVGQGTGEVTEGVSRSGKDAAERGKTSDEGERPVGKNGEMTTGQGS